MSPVFPCETDGLYSYLKKILLVDSHPERIDTGEFIGGAVEEENSETESKGEDKDDAAREYRASRKKSMRNIDLESRLRLLDERLVDEYLSSEEVRAVAAHLKTNYSKAMELISDKQLKAFLASVPVLEINAAKTCASEENDDDERNWVPTDHSELLYERGVPADFCTVVLTGKLTVMSGADKFRSDVSNWGVLGTKALTDPSYVPDFSAWVGPSTNDSNGCRCIKLDRKSFFHAVDNTAVEKTGGVTTTIPQVSNHEAALHNIDSKYGSTPPPTPPRSSHHAPKTPPSDAMQSSEAIISSYHPTYVKPEEQKVVQNKRAKLLNAFKQVSTKDVNPSQKDSS